MARKLRFEKKPGQPKTASRSSSNSGSNSESSNHSSPNKLLLKLYTVGLCFGTLILSLFALPHFYGPEMGGHLTQVLWAYLFGLLSGDGLKAMKSSR